MVWRSFLKDIGELEEGTGKKSTLKESLAETIEHNDKLNKEVERLRETVNGDSQWAEQITTIIETVKPDDIADVVYAGSDHADVAGLTNAMVQRYAQWLEFDRPVATEELLVASRCLSDPSAFIQRNSQKARHYADAILNQLDDQTDEPNDVRLAKRIVNEVIEKERTTARGRLRRRARSCRDLCQRGDRRDFHRGRFRDAPAGASALRTLNIPRHLFSEATAATARRAANSVLHRRRDE